VRHSLPKKIPLSSPYELLSFQRIQTKELAMSTATCSTTVALFPNQEQATEAVDALIRAEFDRSQIGVVASDHITTGFTTTDSVLETQARAENIGNGTAVAVAAGAGIGALIGWGVLAGAVPVIGPALLAGTLGILATNSASGAAVGGVIGALAGWGVSEEHARHYESEIASGRVVVTVSADERTDEAQAILRQFGPTSRDSWCESEFVAETL
jgi:hypothetical protein